MRQVLNVAERTEHALEADSRFDDLFQRLYAPMFGLTYRLLGDRGEVEDVLQEAFLKLASAQVVERPDAEVAAWLRRVCLNLATNRLRDRRRAQERLERVGRLELVEQGADGSPARAALVREERQAVRAALSQIPERQRDCLLLRHAGYSYLEIAATLGLAINSVGVLLARAERAFRATYQEDTHD